MAIYGKRIPVVFGMWSCVLAIAWGESIPSRELAAAIQAIEQAPDPSATVAAYANGAAVDRNDPKLFQAYLIRMVDFGLPELAFHQAQTLTTLESNNGLAWGVIAYVEARRGNMAEAISAINLAGQFAPENPLVERTAGELMAWYDVKADKATLSENARRGLASIRRLLEKHPEFANAYETATKAYKTQASVPEQPPGQSHGESPGSPRESVNSYSDYNSTWDMDWVQPVPWWWWQPVGFFAGSNFFPLTTVLVFNHRDFFFRHHDRFFNDGKDHFFNRDRIGRFFHGSEFNAQRDGRRRAKFFGLSAMTNPSLAASRRERVRQSLVRTRGTSTNGGVDLIGPSMSRRIATRQANTIRRRDFTVGPSIGARSTLSSRRHIMSGSGQQFSSRPQVGSMRQSSMPGMITSPASASWGRHGGGLGVSHRAAGPR
jgi:hypothetical protein